MFFGHFKHFIIYDLKKIYLDKFNFYIKLIYEKKINREGKYIIYLSSKVKYLSNRHAKI